MKTYNDLKFITGIVIDNRDTSKRGRMLVKFEGQSETASEVIYTSPYFTTNGGGVLAVPEVGSEIIALEDSEKTKIYYIATIVDFPSQNEVGGGLKEFNVISDPYVYTEREKPQKVNFTNQFGAGLKISRRVLPKLLSTKVDLSSEGGKRITLSDSPESNLIMIRNEHGDGIIITSEQSDVHPERSIEIKSVGQQNYVSFQSGINFYVIDGRDINIENFSSGAFANTSAATKGRFGNINLRSSEADISIVGKGQGSEIFIVTPKARIQINLDGSVNIEALNVNIKSALNMTLEAQNLSIKSTNLNIKSDALLNVDSPAINVNTQAITGLSTPVGGPVIATGGQQAVVIPILPLTKNDYGE